MTIANRVYRLRNGAGLTQERFAELFGVSQQSVQKWENGSTTPDLERLIAIAKYFDVSLDALILGHDNRLVEELRPPKAILPQYENIHDWEFYSSNLLTEYRQSIEEGLDLEAYEGVFSSVARLPKGEFKKKMGDVLFEMVSTARRREDYAYNEPSELSAIRTLCEPAEKGEVDRGALEDKILGAWQGRVAGCLLGKPVEGIRTDELIPFLKETGNYPMSRYIYRSDLNEELLGRYKFRFANRRYADEIDGMPVDDDTNYTVLYQKVVETNGREFTPFDVSRAWLKLQPKDAYCTAERVAFCNFVKGYAPPQSAEFQNPYREWIGAQIRGDYFGYINPADPAMAAEMAWRDASVSHVKNGIYGEMWVAAMLAQAAVTEDREAILLSGLSQIPRTSRLYEAVMDVIEGYRSGISQEACFEEIHRRWNEKQGHDWCHAISNAMIVAASLLYGEGDFGRSICMAVQTGFDTDCNGATVGSILGMAHGARRIPEYWTAPLHDTLHTSIFGVGTVKISDCAKKTLEHIEC